MEQTQKSSEGAEIGRESFFLKVVVITCTLCTRPVLGLYRALSGGTGEGPGERLDMVRINLTRTPQDKLKNLILLVTEKCTGYRDRHYASTKLNKLLFFSDFLAYRELGRAITGLDYQRLQNGPAPVCMKPILEEMEQRDKSLGWKREWRFFLSREYEYRIPVAYKDPDLSLFSNEEVELVDRVVREHLHESAAEISNRAYEEFGLRDFKILQKIPYGLALIGKGELSQEDIDYAIQNGLVEQAVAWRESRGG
jgi:hypothetical protein